MAQVNLVPMGYDVEEISSVFLESLLRFEDQSWLGQPRFVAVDSRVVIRVHIRRLHNLAGPAAKVAAVQRRASCLVQHGGRRRGFRVTLEVNLFGFVHKGL